MKRIIYGKGLPKKLTPIRATSARYREELVGVVIEATFNWYWPVDGLIEDGYHALRTHQAHKGKNGDSTKNDGRESKVAKMDSESRSVRRPAMLVNDRQVVFIEGGVSDQFVLGTGQCEQAVVLSG